MLADKFPKLTLGRGDEAGDGARDLCEDQLLLEVALLRRQACDLRLFGLDLLIARARQPVAL